MRLRFGLGLGLTPSLGIVLLSRLSFHRAQLGAVRQQLTNKPALGRDDVSLFDHQHDKEAVRDHEQDGKDGQKRVFLGFWRWRCENRVQQAAPRSGPLSSRLQLLKLQLAHQRMPSR